MKITALPSEAIMDEAARLLGATSAEVFLASAPDSMKCAFKLICEMLAALKEARVYVDKFGQQNAETGTQLQADIVALLAKIDAALAPPPPRITP